MIDNGYSPPGRAFTLNNPEPTVHAPGCPQAPPGWPIKRVSKAEAAAHYPEQPASLTVRDLGPPVADPVQQLPPCEIHAHHQPCPVCNEGLPERLQLGPEHKLTHGQLAPWRTEQVRSQQMTLARMRELMAEERVRAERDAQQLQGHMTAMRHCRTCDDGALLVPQKIGAAEMRCAQCGRAVFRTTDKPSTELRAKPPMPDPIGQFLRKMGPDNVMERREHEHTAFTSVLEGEAPAWGLTIVLDRSVRPGFVRCDQAKRVYAVRPSDPLLEPSQN